MEQPESKEHDDELELFASLVESYEKVHFPISLPNPVDAILFAMEQQGLNRKDLIPLLGSQSKVSEVLNRKRSLSLSMIRMLHERLGIPAEILLQDTDYSEIPKKTFGYHNFPVSEMLVKGYFPEYTSLPAVKDDFEALMTGLFSVFGDEKPLPVFYRKRMGKGSAKNPVLLAWQAHILDNLKDCVIQPFDAGSLTDSFLEELLSLSIYPKSPLLVQDFLATVGIYFVIEPHLQTTYLDGASFLSPRGNPVLALTLRYDRLDNFWFTLMHELAHIVLHLTKQGYKGQAFFDDTNAQLEDNEPSVEKEANDFAKSWLLPSYKGRDKENADSSLWTSEKIRQEAEAMHRSPAILAGRIRWELSNYSLYSELLGNNGVRSLFGMA